MPFGDLPFVVQSEHFNQPTAKCIRVGANCPIQFKPQAITVGYFAGIGNTVWNLLAIAELASKNKVVVLALEVRCVILGNQWSTVQIPVGDQTMRFRQ